MSLNISGEDIYLWACDLFPICRSITGDGVRETFKYIKSFLPDLEVHEVPTGTKAFDWVVPQEWNVNDAYVLDPEGRKIIDFKECNLHLVNYSIPFKGSMSLQALQEHLYSLEDQPDAIPYVTSYFKPRWGFCISHKQRQDLIDGTYHIVVDTTLEDGSMTYGECFLEGESKEEILLSTYTCHPSMGNNELSGIVVTIALAKWLSSLPNRRYSYRIVWVPETIGAIVYLSRNWEQMKQQTKAGYVVTCVGDDRTYSYMESRKGDTLADRVAKAVLREHYPDFKNYSFLERGSDERQYCSPGIALPVASIMRSKYAEYPEYHTSLDNLDLISEGGLYGSFEVYKKCIHLLEKNANIKSKGLCEPQMGKRGLRGSLNGSKNIDNQSMLFSNILAYADGEMDLVDYLNLLDVPLLDLLNAIEVLEDQKLIDLFCG